MPNADLDILILAAGLGTRMKSNLAKVLHKLDGRPLINHVCETAYALSPRLIYTVVGHQADDVQAAVLKEVDEEKAAFALQKQQFGTGDGAYVSVAVVRPASEVDFDGLLLAANQHIGIEDQAHLRTCGRWARLNVRIAAIQ